MAAGEAPVLVATVGAADARANAAGAGGAPAAALATHWAGVAAAALAVVNAVLLLVMLPVAWKLSRTLDEVQALTAELREELPDTLAAIRLTGLELGEAAEEFSELGAEVGYGVRTAGGAARAATATTASIGLAVKDRVVPEVQEKVLPAARRVIRDSLAANAAEDDEHTQPSVRARRALDRGGAAVRAVARVARGARVAAYLRRVRRDLGGR